MVILGIDPGNTKSGLVIYSFKNSRVVDARIIDDDDLLVNIAGMCGIFCVDAIAIEAISCMGMVVGQTVFDTVFFSGMLHHAITSKIKTPIHKIKRLDVKMHICHNMRAKDKNIAQALRDRFGEKGTKKNPGGLYGFNSHMYPALAVAATCYDTIYNNI